MHKLDAEIFTATTDPICRVNLFEGDELFKENYLILFVSYRRQF